MPRLCSFGCSANDTIMHSFPNKDKYPERFKMWVSLVGGKLETAFDYRYYAKKKVCARHFTDQDRNRNSRLNVLAVPSLHLLGIPSRQTDVTNPPDVSETNERVNQPSILQPINTDIIQPNLEHSIIEPENFGQLSLSSIGKTPKPAIAIFNEHNYSAVTRTRKAEKSFPVCNCTRKSYTRMQLRNLRSEICHLRKKVGTFKSRLQKLQQMTKPLYTLLYKYFTLPSARAMKRLLSNKNKIMLWNKPNSFRKN